MTSPKPALLLLPNVLSKSSDYHAFLPASVYDAVATIDGIISESVQGGRSFLKRFKTKKKPYDIPLALFNKNTPASDIDFLLEPILAGERWGFVSDAGLPCVADPGAKLVARARQQGMNVEAYVGPSAITLSIMLSGLPCQRFAFHGYIAKDPEKRKIEIANMEKESEKDASTQIFIEAPHRNMHTMESLLETLSNRTLLCVAWDLTMPTQEVICDTVAQWKKRELPDIAKKATTFLLNTYIDRRN